MKDTTEQQEVARMAAAMRVLRDRRPDDYRRIMAEIDAILDGEQNNQQK